MSKTPIDYVIRIRKGKPILVDSQILAWRKYCRKNRLGAYRNTLLDAPGLNMSAIDALDEADPLAGMSKLFSDDNG